MKKAFFVFFLTLLFVFSCEEKAPLPLKEEELITVLRDIHIAEAAMQNLIGITKDSVGEIYYEQTLNLHNIKKADFDSSMVILRRDPDRLGLIYDKIIEELEAVGDSLFQY